MPLHSPVQWVSRVLSRAVRHSAARDVCRFKWRDKGCALSQVKRTVLCMVSRRTSILFTWSREEEERRKRQKIYSTLLQIQIVTTCFYHFAHSLIAPVFSSLLTLIQLLFPLSPFLSLSFLLLPLSHLLPCFPHFSFYPQFSSSIPFAFSPHPVLTLLSPASSIFFLHSLHIFQTCSHDSFAPPHNLHFLLFFSFQYLLSLISFPNLNLAILLQLLFLIFSLSISTLLFLVLLYHLLYFDLLIFFISFSSDLPYLFSQLHWTIPILPFSFFSLPPTSNLKKLSFLSFLDWIYSSYFVLLLQFLPIYITSLLLFLLFFSSSNLFLYPHILFPALVLNFFA